MLNYSLEVMELHMNKDTHVNILGSVIIMLLFIVTCTFVMAFMFAYRAFLVDVVIRYLLNVPFYSFL